MASISSKLSRSVAQPLVVNQTSPIVLWAIAGCLFLAGELYVIGSWVLGPNFVPTPEGADQISDIQRIYFLMLQIGVTGLFLFFAYMWLIKPWLREGRMTSSGRLFAAGSMLFIYDCSMNYTATVLFYNSHLANFGSWTLGSWPGWLSPMGNVLPEPIFVSPPGYTTFVLTQAVFVCWLVRKAKTKWPKLGTLSIIGLIVLGCTIVDSVLETLLVRSGVYAYPGAIRSLTLFAGETYQFPLYEGLLFGGFGIGAMAVLNFFRDDKGQTFVERGVERLRIGEFGKQWLRGLAVYGFCHLMFFTLYMVPMQWFSLNSDPFPEGYPPSLVNNMCVYGVNADQCPGPGVMIPRLPK